MIAHVPIELFHPVGRLLEAVRLAQGEASFTKPKDVLAYARDLGFEANEKELLHMLAPLCSDFFIEMDEQNRLSINSKGLSALHGLTLWFEAGDQTVIGQFPNLLNIARGLSDPVRYVYRRYLSAYDAAMDHLYQVVNQSLAARQMRENNDVLRAVNLLHADPDTRHAQRWLLEVLGQKPSLPASVERAYHLALLLRPCEALIGFDADGQALEITRNEIVESGWMRVAFRLGLWRSLIYYNGKHSIAEVSNASNNRLKVRTVADLDELIAVAQALRQELIDKGISEICSS